MSAEWYRPILALHVIAIISWMAGILYLYRLLIYASENQGRQEIYELLRTMTRRLWKAITVPAMVVAWLAAIWMLMINSGTLHTLWFTIKFVSVLGLTLSTLYAGRLVALYQKQDGPLPSSGRLRVLNEVPTVLMIIIVIMVIVRPFQ